MRRVILLVLGVSLSILGVAAAGAWWATRPPKPIRIGVLHALTGTMAISAQPLVDAAQLAVDEINAGGGIDGRPLEIVIADSRSEAGVAAEEAERLISRDGVAAIFGCWSSVCRKAVKEVVERRRHLLFYPLQYEGLEQSEHVVYLGAAPNQQIIPAVRWSLANLGPRFFLVGSDYLFPHAANAIIRARLATWPAQVVGEAYVRRGDRDVGQVIDAIRASRPDVVLSTLNGDTNIAFFQGLARAGLTADRLPTLSFSIAEPELRHLPAGSMAGHYAAWTYFQTVEDPVNDRFIAAFRARFGEDRVMSDPMEATYVSLKLYAEAARAAESLEPMAVREQLRDRSLHGPGGMTHIDGRNFHAWKRVRIGRIRADGQFEIVWTSPAPVAPEPFPSLRPMAEWTKFLADLQAKWGGRWENPGR